MPAVPDPLAPPSVAPSSVGESPDAHARLLDRARAGDRDAFEQLVVQAMPALLGTAQRLLRHRFAAEEAVADALFRAWRHIGSFRGDSAFGTWLHRIVCRVATDRFRTAARARRHHDHLAARAERAERAQPSQEARLDAASEVARLRAAVETLPTRQRLVIVLHVWEGLSLRDTAALLGMRYATAKSNLCHARKALRLWLEEDEA